MILLTQRYESTRNIASKSFRDDTSAKTKKHHHEPKAGDREDVP